MKIMANNYTTTSLEALKYICSVINKTVDLPSTVISDASIATNTTYSSFKLDKEFTTLEDELKHYTDTAIAGLNKLTKEIINDKSLVVKDNVLYLYKAADNPSDDYMQMMLINGVVIELGSTQVDTSDYYNKTDSDNRFAAKLDLTTLTTSLNDLKTMIGDTTQIKNNTFVEDVKELYTGLDDRVSKTDVVTALDGTVTDEQVASALLTKTELDKINTNLDKKADTDKVVKKIFIRDTSSEDARILIQNHWNELDNFNFFTLRIDTAKWTWNSEIYKHSKDYGTVLLRSYGSDIPSVFYGKLYYGAWTWQELATMNNVAHIVDTSYISKGVLNVLAIKESLGNGCYEIMGQGSLGCGSIRLNIWQLASGAFAFSCCIIDNTGVKSICNNETVSTTADVGTSYFDIANRIVKIF